MSGLELIVNNTVDNPHSEIIVKKALLLANVQNEINVAEIKRNNGYAEFKKQLLKPESRDALQKAMLYCAEQCANLRALIRCSRLIEETL